VGATDHEAFLVVFSEPGPAVELKEFNGKRFGHFIGILRGYNTSDNFAFACRRVR
jgi:hypothetical protein